MPFQLSSKHLLAVNFFQSLRLMPKPCSYETFPLDYLAVISNSVCLKLHIIFLPPVFLFCSCHHHWQSPGTKPRRYLAVFPCPDLYGAFCAHICLWGSFWLVLAPLLPAVAMRASSPSRPCLTTSLLGIKLNFPSQHPFCMYVYSFLFLNIVSWLILLLSHVLMF